MSDYESEMLSEMKRVAGLLELLAEDKIAQRDRTQRAKLIEIVGGSPKKRASIYLMNGERTQAEIQKLTSVDQSDLSKMITQLYASKLLSGDKKTPQLVISIPANFFENNEKAK